MAVQLVGGSVGVMAEMLAGATVVHSAAQLVVPMAEQKAAELAE